MLRAGALLAAVASLVAGAPPAGAATQSPRWSDPPRALSGTFLATAAGGESVVTFAAPVEGARPLRVSIALRVPGAPTPAPLVRVLDGRWVTARWPAALLPPGAAAEARFCAEDSAGRRACATALRFTAPRPDAAAPDAPRRAPRGGALLGAAALALLGAVRGLGRRASRLA